MQEQLGSGEQMGTPLTVKAPLHLIPISFPHPRRLRHETTFTAKIGLIHKYSKDSILLTESTSMFTIKEKVLQGAKHGL